MNVAIYDHAVMKLLDAFAARAPEREGEERVEEAGRAAEDHPRGEAAGRAQVLQVGLTYRSRMLCEKAT